MVARSANLPLRTCRPGLGEQILTAEERLRSLANGVAGCPRKPPLLDRCGNGKVETAYAGPGVNHSALHMELKVL